MISERYCELILYTFIGHLNEDDIAGGWFQQDGATAHTARVSMALLRFLFGERLISRDIWRPKSLELSPPDFYLWEAMKDFVYKDNHCSLRHLNEATTNLIRNIPVLNWYVSSPTR
jgi:hypothetical protein